MDNVVSFPSGIDAYLETVISRQLSGCLKQTL